jgi:uncharacterized protein (TIGR00369 family)
MTNTLLDADSARHAFETALRDHRPEFEHFFLARFFGLQFEYGEGTCTIRFQVHDFMFNPQGSLHGGVIAFALDVSMGHLLRHTLNAPGSTVEMKTQYFAPVRGPHVRCESRFLHKGKSLLFLETRMFDADGTLAAAATSTWSVRKPASPEA